MYVFSSFCSIYFVCCYEYITIERVCSTSNMAIHCLCVCLHISCVFLHVCIVLIFAQLTARASSASAGLGVVCTFVYTPYMLYFCSMFVVPCIYRSRVLCFLHTSTYILIIRLSHQVGSGSQKFVQILGMGV